MGAEAYPSCRFYVMIDGQPQGVFTEVGGLQVEMDVMDYQEGGNNGFVHRLPGVTRVSNLTLKRGMTSSNEFYKWCAEIAGGQFTRRHITVVMYDSAGNQLMRWNVMNAYPVKWVGPQLLAPDNAAAVETLELAHEGIELG
jgi:phage tail-like protein